MCIFRIVPESPRWLVAKDQDEKARKIVKKIAVVNGKLFPESVKLTTIDPVSKRF